MDERYEILRIISDSAFLVLDVRDIVTDEKMVVYTMWDVDFTKKLHTANELHITY